MRAQRPAPVISRHSSYGFDFCMTDTSTERYRFTVISHIEVVKALGGGGYAFTSLSASSTRIRRYVMANVREATFDMLGDRKWFYRALLPDDLSPFGGYHQLAQRHHRHVFRLLEAAIDANELVFKYPHSTNFFRGLLFPSVTPPIPLLCPHLTPIFGAGLSPFSFEPRLVPPAPLPPPDVIAIEESRAIALLECPRAFCDPRIAVAFSAWYWSIMYERTCTSAEAQDGAADGDS